MKFATKLLLLALLTSCTSNDTSNQSFLLSKSSYQNSRLEDFRKADNSVVLLLPMSGPNKTIGENVLNACVLGSKNSNIDIYVIDTNDVPDELQQSNFHNLKAVVGPVFFKETYKFASIFQSVPLFSLSNNISANNSHIYACGLAPQEEINAVFRYLRKHKLHSLTVFLPEGDFAKSIAPIIHKAAARYGMDEETFNIVSYNSSANLDELTQDLNTDAIFTFEPITSSTAKVFTMSSLALSNPEKWEGVMFAYVDTTDQRSFIEKYKKTFNQAPTIISLAAHDIIKMINESLTKNKDMFGENYNGTLGHFQLKKNAGISRNLEIFKIENSEKVPA